MIKLVTYNIVLIKFSYLFQVSQYFKTKHRRQQYVLRVFYQFTRFVHSLKRIYDFVIRSYLHCDIYDQNLVIYCIQTSD